MLQKTQDGYGNLLLIGRGEPKALEGEIFGGSLGAQARGNRRQRLEQAMNEGAAPEANVVLRSQRRSHDVDGYAPVKCRGCMRGRKPGGWSLFQRCLFPCPVGQRLKRLLCSAAPCPGFGRRHLLEMLVTPKTGAIVVHQGSTQILLLEGRLDAAVPALFGQISRGGAADVKPIGGAR